MSFWQQDAEKVVVTLPGPPDGAVGDVEVVLTANSLRVSLRSSGTTLCDAALHAGVKSGSGRYGIKTWRSADGVVTHSVVLCAEKAVRGEEWPALFAAATPADAQPPQVITRVRTAYEYAPTDTNELGFAPGAVITVLFQDPSGWWQGFLDGQQGNFPSNFVEPLDDAAGAGGAPFDIDDPAAAVPTARPGPAAPRGAAMGGLGFGAAITGELGNALKRRTVMNPAGISQLHAQQREREREQATVHRPAPAPAPAPTAAPVVQTSAGDEPVLPQITLEPGVTQVRATADYEGGEGEISFAAGDTITVWATDPSGWWEGECRGARGSFPANFTEKIAPAPRRPASTDGPAGPAGRGRGGIGRGAPAVRGRKPGSAPQAPEAGNNNNGGGGLPFAVNLKPRSQQQHAEPKPAEDAQGSGGGLPFPVKLKSVGNNAAGGAGPSAGGAGAAPPAKPGPKPRPVSARPAAPQNQTQGAKEAEAPVRMRKASGPAPAPGAGAPAGAAGVKEWPSTLPDFATFCAGVQSAVGGATVRGVQSHNLPPLPSERGCAVCTLDGHVQTHGAGDAVPLAAAVVPALYAYCEHARCAPPAAQLAGLDAVRTGLVLTAACLRAQDDGRRPWDVTAGFAAFVAGRVRGAGVGYSLAAYLKARGGAEGVWGAAHELRMRRALPDTCDAGAVADMFLQLCSLQLPLDRAARLAASLAKDAGVVALAAACSVLKGAPVVGGESGLALALLPKLGGIAVYAPELAADAHTPAIAEPVLGPLAAKHADVFAC